MDTSTPSVWVATPGDGILLLIDKIISNGIATFFILK